MNKMLKNILLFWYKKSEKILHQNLWLNKSRYIRYYRRHFNLYIVSRYKSNYVEINNQKIHLDKNDSLKLSLCGYGKEKEDTALIRRFTNAFRYSYTIKRICYGNYT